MEKAQQKLDFFDSLSSPKGRAKGDGKCIAKLQFTILFPLHKKRVQRSHCTRVA